MKEPNTKNTQQPSAFIQGARVFFRSAKTGLKSFFAEWGTVVGIAAVAAAVVGGGMLFGLGMRPGTADDVASKVASPASAEEPAFRRAIDGVPVASAEEVDPPLAAIAIDNMIDAWPQSGISQAALVIEAPVEAGITRLLAFFPLAPGADVAKIGPVRSARPYFIDWAMEYDALYGHVGGSPEALAKIQSSAVRDLNEYSGSAYYWRDKQRLAPHNVYTSTDLLKTAFEKRETATPDRALTPWVYGPEKSVETRPTGDIRIVINYQNALYRAGWTYDRERNEYVRTASDTEDAGNGEIVRARNVVVQFSKVTVLDDVGRRRIETTGGGELIVFTGGSAVKGTWARETGERLRFLDAYGNTVALLPGTTWIEVVPQGTNVTY